MNMAKIIFSKKNGSIGMIIILLFMVNACSENDLMNSGYLKIDDTRLKIDPELLIINYNDLLFPSAGCESKYLQFRIMIHSGKNTLWYLAFAGPAMDNGFLPGEYPISADCHGAVNFIETGKVVSELYQCQEWNDFYGEYYTTTCRREVSREEYYFQNDEFFHEQSGEGALKILSVDQTSKRISFELDLDVNFAAGSIVSQSISRKKITAKYNGTYVEDWLGPIQFPWMQWPPYEGPPIDTCGFMYGYPDKPIKPVIKQRLELEVNGVDDVTVKGAISMFDDRAIACYSNTVVFSNYVFRIFYNGAQIARTEILTEPQTVDFGNFPSNEVRFQWKPGLLVLNQGYLIVLTTQYFVKDMYGGFAKSDISISSSFKIGDSPYVCINENLDTKYCN